MKKIRERVHLKKLYRGISSFELLLYLRSLIRADEFAKNYKDFEDVFNFVEKYKNKLIKPHRTHVDLSFNGAMQEVRYLMDRKDVDVDVGVDKF